MTVEDAPDPANSRERLLHEVAWLDARVVCLWTGVPIPPGIPEVLGNIPPRPILFIDIGQAEGRALLRHFYELAGEPQQLWEVPEARHGAQFQVRPGEYETIMVAFFDAALLRK